MSSVKAPFGSAFFRGAGNTDGEVGAVTGFVMGEGSSVNMGLLR